MLSGKAFAKINLGLNITGKRQDGYHEITTFMHTISLFDEIKLKPNKLGDFRLIQFNGEPIPEENTLKKVYQLLKAKKSFSEGFDIEIIKHIPSGAGLGGPSTDAACLLELINTFLNLKMETTEKENLLSEVGCDCPFFVNGGFRKATGKGTDFGNSLIPLEDFLVLICFQTSLSTGEAYSSLSLPKTGNPVFKELDVEIPKIQGIIPNDFQCYAFKNVPELKDVWKILLENNPFGMGMTGKGPTLYGIFKERKQAESVSNLLRNLEYNSQVLRFTSQGMNLC